MSSYSSVLWLWRVTNQPDKMPDKTPEPKSETCNFRSSGATDVISYSSVLWIVHMWCATWLMCVACRICYVWHDSLICGTWLMSHDMTHDLLLCVMCGTLSYVGHDSWITLFHMWDMIHESRHDSRPIAMCGVCDPFICGTWFMSQDMTHDLLLCVVCVTLSYVGHDSWITLFHMWDMVHESHSLICGTWFVRVTWWYDALLRMIWLFRVCGIVTWRTDMMTWRTVVCDMTDSCVWHDDMTHCCVWHDNYECVILVMCVTWLVYVCPTHNVMFNAGVCVCVWLRNVHTYMPIYRVYECICIYIYICTYEHIYTYVYIWVHICIHICINIYIYLYIYIYGFINLYVSIYIYKFAYIHIYISMRI